MATLLELKTRVRLETNKDDIASGGEAEAALTNAITRAIEYYADEDFWFTQGAEPASSVASSATIDLPAAIRIVTAVGKASVNQGLLIKVPISEIEHSSGQGVPTHWTNRASHIRLWPIPDAVYNYFLYGTLEFGIPASDGASNVWTVQGYDLIAARTRMLLYRDLWRDTEGAVLAAQAEQEALAKLKRETRKRDVTPLRSRGDEPFYPNRFNIFTG